MSIQILEKWRGRVALSSGQGPGESNYILGQTGGTETTTLTINQMPAHSHRVLAVDEHPNKDRCAGNALANFPGYSSATPTAPMSAGMIQPSGGSQPISNLQPYLTLNYIIALQGIFPSRS